MIIDGKEVQGVILPVLTDEEIEEKLTPAIRQEWLELFEEQDRRIEEWQNEHNF
ncbi:hypothetical protein [Fructobacillus fructosus]|jgi:hypothetical protein|uniref:Uncharacterized protein n=1 Tax=Fructobacillus fructosus TaxID=1631 RepID=A0ABN9YLF1_9LACO|nr:hypothetical protein [Fructobacillus fructosus]MBD9365418.1 hypothetical protein [Leuconostoc mesenteroides]KRN52462.1 hypothetical protein IV71_GL001286 [Fructobacillus fructosus KCTC 3544]MBC9118754.1 hypothetical protein [Fructobacillus fructosus]MCK8637881.1 hypothetical protein [Fructobacillus fructosus]CAK1230882.1 unnamed protein product [Fructobacillus fructosus]